MTVEGQIPTRLAEAVTAQDSVVETADTNISTTDREQSLQKQPMSITEIYSSYFKTIPTQSDSPSRALLNIAATTALNSFTGDLPEKAKGSGIFKKILNLGSKSSDTTPHRAKKNDDTDLAVKNFTWKVSPASIPIILQDQVNCLQKLFSTQYASTSNKQEFRKQISVYVSEIAHSSLQDDGSISPSKLHASLMALSLLSWMIDLNPEQMEELFNSDVKENLIPHLKKIFLENLSNLQQKLKIHYNTHENSGLQTSAIAVHHELNRQIALLLITRTGALNHGLIEILLHNLPQSNLIPTIYLEKTLHNLRRIQDDSDLHKLFNDVILTDSLYAPAHTVIRATLHLPLETLLLKQHACQAMLTALLSNLRQGSAGSCFATSLAIYLKEAQPVQCLRDLKSLLVNNTLTRIINGVEMHFPYLLRVDSQTFNQNIQLNADGHVASHKPAYILWETPGMLRIATSLGIKNLTILMEPWLKEQYEGRSKEDLLLLTLKEVIENIIKTFCKKSKNVFNRLEAIESQELCAIAQLIFAAEECNPLLKVWENAIAGMAEGQETGYVRKLVLGATTKTIASIAMQIMEKRYGKVQLEFENTIKQRFFVHFKHVVRIQYDPSMDHRNVNSNQHVAYDQRSSQGAFVVYNTGGNLSKKQGKRIDKPELYQLLVNEVWQNTMDSCKGYIRFMSDDFTYLKSSVSKVIHTSSFLTGTLIHSAQEKITAILNEPLQNLKKTPWISYTGNSPEAVIEVYLQLQDELKKNSFTPKNTDNLFFNIRHIIKNTASLDEFNDPQSYLINPYLLTPIRIKGVHSFSLMLHHPTLLNIFNFDSELKKLKEIGHFLADDQVSTETSSSIFNYITEKIVPENPDFKIYYDALPVNSLYNFRCQLENLLKAVKPDTASLPAHMRSLDSVIFKFLTTEQRTQLIKTTVHFADTNWNEGFCDLHFCFVFNPCTKNLEMWQVTDDHSKFIALDQQLWLDKTWEYYPEFHQIAGDYILKQMIQK